MFSVRSSPRPKVVAKLLELGARADGRDGNGVTPLFGAVSSNCIETVQLLAERNVDINPGNKDRFTPLQLACKLGLTDIARPLVERGANATACDNQRTSALHYAAIKGDVDLVRLLLERGADSLARNIAGKSLFSLPDPAIAEIRQKAPPPHEAQSGGSCHRGNMKEGIQISRFSRCKCWTSGRAEGNQKMGKRGRGDLDYVLDLGTEAETDPK
jgi:hypothetical protein